MRDKPVGLIKRGSAGLENLIISPSPKRRIGERAVTDDFRYEYQNPPCQLNVAPCVLQRDPWRRGLRFESEH
jgi:hypothetical protein